MNGNSILANQLKSLKPLAVKLIVLGFLALNSISVVAGILNIPLDLQVPYTKIDSITAAILLVALISWIFLAYDIRSADLDYPASKQRIPSTGARALEYLLLGMCITTAAIVSYSPYFFSSKPRGVDVGFYLTRLDAVKNLNNVLMSFTVEPRTPYLLLLFILKSTGLTTVQSIQVGPVLLAILFTLAVFFLLRAMTNELSVAIVGAFLSATSFHITVGLFAGIYANWLALSMVATFFLFSSRIAQRSSWLVAAIVNAYLVLVTHAWTWGILMATIAVSMALALHRGLRQVRVPFILLVSSAFPVTLLLFVPAVSHNIGGAMAGYMEFLQTLRISNLLYQSTLLPFTLNTFVGGFLQQPLLYLLALLGMVELRQRKMPMLRFLCAWFMILTGIVLLQDPFYQWRLLYLGLFEVPAAFGVKSASCAIAKLLGRETKLSKTFQLMFIVGVALYFIQDALKSTAQIPTIN